MGGSAGAGGSQVGAGGVADSGPGGAAGSGGSDPLDAADAEPRVDVADAAGKADGSDAAQTGVSYVGCMYIGQIDRMVIAKRDIPRGLCFNLVLTGPGPATPGLTVPPGYGLDYASAGPSSACPSLGFSSPRATQVTGIVEGRDGGTLQVRRVNVHVTMSFPANDAGVPATELLEAEDVDVDRECSR